MIPELEPAQIALTQQNISRELVINRRHPLRRSQATFSILAFRSLQTKNIIGIAGHFPMHPTTLSYHNKKISADYPGRFCAIIEKLSQNTIIPIFFTGAAGDLNPITTCGTNFEVLEKDAEARKKVYDQQGTYVHTRTIGYYLGKKALKLAKSIPLGEFYDSLEVRSQTRNVSITIQDFQPYIYNWRTWLQNKILFGIKRFILLSLSHLIHKGNKPNFPAMQLEQDSDTVSILRRLKVETQIQLYHFHLASSRTTSLPTPKDRILFLLGVPGEVFEELSFRLKKLIPKSPDTLTNILIFQNTNDWIAYLFNIKEYLDQSGYEPIVSASPTCGEEIYHAFKNLIRKEKNFSNKH